MEQHQKISTTVVSGLPFITYIKNSGSFYHPTITFLILLLAPANRLQKPSFIFVIQTLTLQNLREVSITFPKSETKEEIFSGA